MIRRSKAPTAANTRASRDWRSYDEVAEAYDRVRSPVHGAPAADLVAAVRLPQDGLLLDVGTGTGLAARSVEAGLAVGVDISLGMARVAQARGLRRVAVAAAIDLPFRDGTFDAVVSAFVLHLVPKYETALFDMARVLRRGGNLGLATWVAADDEFTRTWREVAESFATKEMLADAQRKAAPWALQFSDPERIEEILRAAGFRDVRVEKRTYRSDVTIDDYLTGRETTAIGRFMKEMLGAALWERFRSRIDEEFRSRFRDPIGDTNEVLLTVATREK
jgi:phosphatidylethanolamine/phosphatidyl-N-methylethanolamine N-methyltransferase